MLSYMKVAIVVINIATGQYMAIGHTVPHPLNEARAGLECAIEGRHMFSQLRRHFAGMWEYVGVTYSVYNEL